MVVRLPVLPVTFGACDVVVLLRCLAVDVELRVAGQQAVPRLGRRVQRLGQVCKDRCRVSIWWVR